jgi:D-serine deaminase-like pyridoxal phosphate-dependent protein
LAKKATISFAADDAGNLQEASDVAKEMGVTLHVAIEVNVGQFWCGVEPGEAVVPLAKIASSLPGLSFKGIHCYNGLA